MERRVGSELNESVAALRRALDVTPTAAVVLGSGLGGFTSSLADARSVETSELPHFPTSTVAGHAGRIVAGTLAGVEVVVSSGRVHTYEGRSIGEVTWAVRVCAALGARSLLLTNAAGSMRTSLLAGELMLVRDHVNLTFQRLLDPADLQQWVPASRGGGGRGPDPLGEGVYSERLARCAREAAISLGVPLREGVLVFGRGPSYETASEVALYSEAGHAACMSTVPEAIAGRLAGLEVLALSCISNLGTGLSAKHLSHEEVTAVAADTAPRVRALLTETLLRAHGNGG